MKITFTKQSVLFLLLLLTTCMAYAQGGLVVNEISQGSSGSREYAELVVVGDPCTTVDLRGWIFDDNNGEFTDCAGPNSGALSGVGVAPGHMVFSNHPIWEEVPVGTIIFLYAFDPNTSSNQANTGGYTPDYDYECDFRMVIPLNQSSAAYILEDLFFPRGPTTSCPTSQTCPNGGDGNPGYTGGGAFGITNSSWTGSGPVSMRNGGDAFQIRMPNATFFHGLSYGEGAASCFANPIALTGGPDGLHINDSGGNKVYHFLNTTSDDFRDVSNWSSGSASANETPAEPNNCANAEWIASLRRPWESVLNTGSGCVEPVENYTICIGESVTLDLPVNMNNCTSIYTSNVTGSGGFTVSGSTSAPPFTITGVSTGTILITITATLTNQDLFIQGGCSGSNTFQESLDYTFSVTITLGPDANDLTIFDCQDGAGSALINLDTYTNSVITSPSQTVVWQHIVGGNLVDIPNTSNYYTGPTTVFAQVTEGDCTTEATVTIDLAPAPVPNNATLEECDTGNGTVNWNLDAAASQIVSSGGSANNINYYFNSNGTNQINNTNPFVSGNATIYAAQTTGACESEAVPITLSVLPIPDAADISFVATPASGCGSTSVDVTFDINGGGCYDLVMNVGGSGVALNDVSDGDVENFTFNNSGTINIESIAFCNENCPLIPTANPTLITIGDAPDLVAVNSPVTICTPETVDLTAHINDANNTSATITFHSASPASAANQLGSSIVSPTVNTTYYAFASLGPNCEDEEPIQVNVTPSATPMLSTATLCESDADLDLNTLEDVAYTNGSWSGMGVTGDVFDPSGLNGPITLTFDSSDACVADATTTVTVTPANMANLMMPAPVCNASGLVDLTAFEDPAYSGSWTGPNVVGDMFDPSSYGTESVVVQFTPDAACTGADPTTIQITAQATPTLGVGQICNNVTTFDLTTLQDASYTTGAWSGAGVTGTNFDPSGIASPATVTFTSDEFCVAAATTTIDILTNPSLINLVTDNCDVTNTTYEVSFEITGGTAPYTVNATPIAGNTYSEIFNTGDPYSFVIDDVNGCNPIMIDGTTNCACATAAGTMNAMPGPLTPCINAIYNVNPFYDSTNENLDGNDILAFVLHDNAGTSLGNILEISYGGVFGAPFNVVPNQTYYVSAVIGNDNGGSVDLSDPCLSVSQGLEVIFVEPSATLSMGGEVCEGDCYMFDVTFIGTAPFGFTYLDSNTGVSTTMDNIMDNPYSLEICTTTDTDISITQVTDADCTIDIANPIAETVTVTPIITTQYFQQLCEGDSIFVNGVLFNEDMLTGQVTFTNTVSGCDSIVDVTIAYTIIDTVFITETLCAGEELVVNGTPYNEAMPSGVEIAPASSGLTCDTTIVIDLTFSDAITLEENGPLCNGDTIFVNNNAYHAGNTIGQEVMLSQAGCDSIVNIDLVVLNNSLVIYDDILCTGGSITVNGMVYDETNPSDTLLFENDAFNGCDSLIYIDLTFNTEVLNLIDTTICFGDTVIIEGMEFHAANDSFSETFMGGSYLGCDSTITIEVFFYNEVVFDLTGDYCAGEEVMVGMDVYNMAMSAGTTIIENGSYLGCDSTVNVNLVFNTAGVNNIDTTICEGDMVEFFGQFYDCNTPMASETIVGGNWAGCDSIINLTINCNPESFFDFTTTICTGDTIFVNGNPYYEGNATGTEIVPLGNQFDCDSTINVAISFSDFVSFDLIETLCTTDSVVVNGVTYDFDNPIGMETIPMGSFLGCDSVVNVNLSFFPLSTNLIDDTLCEGESIIVNGTTYDMNMPMGIEVVSGGSFNNCDSTITVDLTFVPATEFNINEQLCDGETIEIGGQIFDESIMTSITLPDANFNGCDSTININLEFLEPSSFTLIETLPAGGSIVVGGTTFDASMPDGTVVLTGQSYTGCDSTVIVLLSFETPVVAVDEVTPTCFGGNDGSLTITEVPSGVGPYDISIESTGFVLNGDLPILIPNLSAGVYVITIVDANGTEVEIIEVVNQAPELVVDLGEDETIDMGEDYEFDPQFNFVVDSFAWTPTTYFENPDTLYPTAINPGINTNYTLFVQDENGCFTTDDFTLIVNRERLVYIPNAFSPNGDGSNDVFTIYSNKGVAEVQLFQVFDRWGNLVFQDGGFQPNDLTRGWNGIFNGQAMNPAVYVFYATILFKDGEVEVYQGDVTLMR